MSGPPPPPPPHGENPKTTGLPPGNYDIFIIPPHSSGGGFLYLPSLKPNVNSFAAGFATALILVVLVSALRPAIMVWWNSVKGAGGAGMIMIMFAVGVGAWALGRVQSDGGPSHGHGGGANYSGPPPPPPHGNSYSSSQSNGYAGAPPPNGAGAGAGPQAGPRPGGSWQGPPPGTRGAADGNPADGAAKSAWEKAREETKRKEEERKAKEAERRRKEEVDRKLREVREKEAREREAREKKQRDDAEALRKLREDAELRRKEDERRRKEEDEARARRTKEEEEAHQRRLKEEEARRKIEEEIRLRRMKEEEEAHARRMKAEAELLAKRKKLDDEEQAKKAKDDAAAALKQKKIDELREKLRAESAARMKAHKAAQAEENKKKQDAEFEKSRLAAEKPKGSTYAFSAVGEKTNPWPQGRPVSPVAQPKPAPQTARPPPAAARPPPYAASTAPRQTPPVRDTTPRQTPPVSPTKRPPVPTANSYVGTEEETYSYRPYDKPKRPMHAKSPSSCYSESSYAASQSTSRTTPPPSQRGPYRTKDPDKIVIKAVYAFNNAFLKTPTSQLVSGVGSVTDGLILRITTEGLFIDDDVRHVPQREWDVKAWTMKLVEVWCPSFRQNDPSATSRNASRDSPSSHKSHFARLWGLDKDKAATSEETDALLVEMLQLCKNNCHRLRAASSASYDSDSAYGGSTVGGEERTNRRAQQTGQDQNKRLHVLRASIRDQEGKKYVFVIDEEESWKVAVGLQRLRRGTQVRALGVSGMSVNDSKTTLENLGWM